MWSKWSKRIRDLTGKPYLTFEHAGKMFEARLCADVHEVPMGREPSLISLAPAYGLQFTPTQLAHNRKLVVVNDSCFKRVTTYSHEKGRLNSFVLNSFSNRLKHRGINFHVE